MHARRLCDSCSSSPVQSRARWMEESHFLTDVLCLRKAPRHRPSLCAACYNTPGDNVLPHPSQSVTSHTHARTHGDLSQARPRTTTHSTPASRTVRFPGGSRGPEPGDGGHSGAPQDLAASFELVIGPLLAPFAQPQFRDTPWWSQVSCGLNLGRGDRPVERQDTSCKGTTNPARDRHFLVGLLGEHAS